MIIIDSSKNVKLNSEHLQRSYFSHKRSLQNATLYFNGTSFFYKKYIEKLTVFSDKEFEKNLIYLDFGVIFILMEDKIILYNDLYGVYPIFKHQKSGTGDLVISNDILYLKNEFNLGFSKYYLIDFYLFHHTVGKETIYNKIDRLQGSCKIVFSSNGYKSESLTNYSSLIQMVKPVLRSPVESLSDYLQYSIGEAPVNLTLTGGFDSRLLLGVMMSMGNEFSAMTWGIENNLQSHIAKSLSKQFKIEHVNIFLDKNFENKISSYIEEIFSTTPESPFILDMPQFIHFSQKIIETGGKTDLVTGFMGSEIIRSPSYSSEVLLTKFAADISKVQSQDELQSLILKKLKEADIFKDECIIEASIKLVKRYSAYTQIYKKDNTNVIDYLLREKYGKVYSQIIQLHRRYKINLINPYLSTDFIVPFIKNNFYNNPNDLYNTSTFENFKAYRRYAKIMKESFPSILNTRVDKGGYKIKDLLTIKGNIMILLKKYFLFHKKIRKQSYSPVIKYHDWYKTLVINAFKDSDNHIFALIDFDKIHKKVERYDKLNIVGKNDLIVILGLYLNEKYLKKDDNKTHLQ